MQLKPRNTKFRKEMRRSIPLKIRESIRFGSFAIKSHSSNLISLTELESVRKILAKRLKKFGKLWVLSLPSSGFTKKPKETRMGKGKGEVESWFLKAPEGKILFEFEGLSLAESKKLFHSIAFKLSVKVGLININKTLLW